MVFVEDARIAGVAFVPGRIRTNRVRVHRRRPGVCRSLLCVVLSGSRGLSRDMSTYHVHFEQLESIPLAVLRRQAHSSELSRVVPECCGLVWNAVRAQKTKAGRHVAVYWDDSIRLEVGVELEGPFTEDGEVVRSATPAGTVAWVTHLGPYHRLGAAHQAIHEWAQGANHRLAGPKWEIYGHWKNEWDADPSQIRTDVFYLVK
jgi:effector-binding domain-containing protein